MKDYLVFCLMTLSAVFFIVDPFALVPLFVTMTSHDPPAKQRRMAARATVVAFGLLTGFTLCGRLVFRVFGITLGAFKAAGGFLLLLTALDMLRAQPSRTRTSPEETDEGTAKDDVAIFPLAMPMLAGPGAIATVMVLAGRGPSWLHTVPVVVASIALTCLASYLILRAALPINRMLGRSGLALMERIMGLLLAAIAMQFMVDGVGGFLPLVGKP